MVCSRRNTTIENYMVNLQIRFHFNSVNFYVKMYSLHIYKIKFRFLNIL